MSFAEKLMQAYFNLIYNPVYDFTTGRLRRYYNLQKTCIGKFDFKDGDSILCVGVGTGNEVLHILQSNRNVSIVGVDYSETALQRAYAKATKSGKEIMVINMDARHLEFAPGTFDKVLCLHVMDFVEDNHQVTNETFRVLKEGGQFVVTYPSDTEGVKLGSDLLKDTIRTSLNSGRNRFKVILDLVPRVLIGFVYLPQLILRPKKKIYSRRELRAMIAQLTDAGFHIEEEPIYQDFIVYGRKSTKGGKSNAF